MNIDHVALLARLRLSEKEKDLIAGQMSNIIQYVESLNELDTENVEPTAHVLPIKNVFREDVPAPPLPRDEALRNAPDKDDRFYRVPRIID